MIQILIPDQARVFLQFLELVKFLTQQLDLVFIKLEEAMTFAKPGLSQFF